MAENNQFDAIQTDDHLAERLRGEALADRPDFSEELHRRIIRSVGERQAEARTLRARGATAGRRRRSAAVLATACTIVVAAACWILVPGLMQSRDSKTDALLVKKYPYLNGRIENLPPLNGLSDRAAEELDILLVSSGFKISSSQLTDDAQAMADLFLNRIPYDMDQPEDR